MKKNILFFAVVLFVTVSAFSQKAIAQEVKNVTGYVDLKKEGLQHFIKIDNKDIKFIRVFRQDGTFVNKYSVNQNGEWTSIHYSPTFTYCFDTDSYGSMERKQISAAVKNKP